MRSLLVLIACASTAYADVRVGAAIGAGGQGEATYSALEARFDAEWSWGRIGLGVRGVWLDGEWRRGDWERPVDAVRAVRLVELAGEAGAARLAVAAGGLAPAQLAHVADGYRAGLDDRQRTGVRAVAATKTVATAIEIDDVLEPGFVGGAVEWELVPRLVGYAATAVDPDAREAAIEVAAARRWARERSRIDAGGGIVGEPGLGIAALAFASGAIDRAGARWSASAELRAGSGTVGAAFGPLHRIERAELYARARTGVGGAVSAGVVGRAGWLRVGVRARPELGSLATIAVGAPMGRWAQVGAWIAASRRDAAGAGELRIAWAKRLASALEVARMYDTSTMEIAPAWSATAWFSVATD